MKAIYFSHVWPKLNVSAASVRTVGIIESLQKAKTKITFISPAKKSKMEVSDIVKYDFLTAVHCDPNDAVRVNKSFEKMGESPDIAIFDTFVAEEMYSHHVAREFPNCIRIVDNQDFHSLRNHRMKILTQQLENKKLLPVVKNESLWEQQVLSEVLKAKPSPYDDELCARELASYLRSDLVLTCSEYEQFLLKNHFGVNSELVTFFYPSDFKEPLNLEDPEEKEHKEYGFHQRKNFVWLGNYQHPPNLDSVNYILQHVWPLIRQEIPHAELHLYGANCPESISAGQIEGVKAKGQMSSLRRLRKYRAMLAPLRFGAGIKGKILDSWFYGTPVITTPIGAEGMFRRMLNGDDLYQKIDPKAKFYSELNQTLSGINENLSGYYQYTDDWLDQGKYLEFGGLCRGMSAEEIARDAIIMYKDRELWEKKVLIGRDTILDHMTFNKSHAVLQKHIAHHMSKMEEKRRTNQIQALLWSESLRSHEKLFKYLSLKKQLSE